jgi:hypothetical protein
MVFKLVMAAARSVAEGDFAACRLHHPKSRTGLGHPVPMTITHVTPPPDGQLYRIGIFPIRWSPASKSARQLGSIRRQVFLG